MRKDGCPHRMQHHCGRMPETNVVNQVYSLTDKFREQYLWESLCPKRFELHEVGADAKKMRDFVGLERSVLLFIIHMYVCYTHAWDVHLRMYTR